MKSPATYAALEALPPHTLGQIVDGELFAIRSQPFGHAYSRSALLIEVGSAVRARGSKVGAWEVVAQPELHFGADVLVPDIAGWKVDNLPSGVTASTAFVTLAPDWVCEVLSPSTASLDRVRKSRRYASEGVSWSWLVDPVGKTLEAYKLDNGLWVQLGTWSGDETPRVPPFDAIELELAALWLDDPTP